MKPNKAIHNRMSAVVRPVVMSVFGLGLLLAAGSATAGKFGVKVVNEMGEPVSGASVCVGLPGNYKQFGALFTDAKGNAMVDVPNVPFVVTVSKTRFSGIRLAEPARGFNLIKNITLAEGTPGPRCKAGSTLASASSIVIKNVDVNEANRSGRSSITLNPAVTGAPSHYRVSASPEFSDANWQQFSNSIPLVGRLSDHAEVYVQMRRLVGSGNSWLEARSEIVTVQLPVIR